MELDRVELDRVELDRVELDRVELDHSIVVAVICQCIFLLVRAHAGHFEHIV